MIRRKIESDVTNPLYLGDRKTMNSETLAESLHIDHEKLLRAMLEIERKYYKQSYGNVWSKYGIYEEFEVSHPPNIEDSKLNPDADIIPARGERFLRTDGVNNLDLIDCMWIIAHLPKKAKAKAFSWLRGGPITEPKKK